MLPVAPRIVNNISYVMRINHEVHFAWQAQSLVKLRCHFSWQGQHLVMLQCHFFWQAQHLVMLQCHFSWQAPHFFGKWVDSRTMVGSAARCK